MSRFELFITKISWETGSKNRPVLVLSLNDDNVLVYPVTTQYENKNEAIRAKYFLIRDWTQAGLDKQSYIDTGTIIKLPLSIINNKNPIGQLSILDKQRLLDFISKF